MKQRERLFTVTGSRQTQAHCPATVERIGRPSTVAKEKPTNASELVIVSDGARRANDAADFPSGRIDEHSRAGAISEVGFPSPGLRSPRSATRQSRVQLCLYRRVEV